MPEKSGIATRFKVSTTAPLCISTATLAAMAEHLFSVFDNIEIVSMCQNSTPHECCSTLLKRQPHLMGNYTGASCMGTCVKAGMFGMSASHCFGLSGTCFDESI